MALSKITTAALSSSSSTSNLNIDDGTLFVNVSNNTVGIGTTTPAAKLHLQGTGSELPSRAIRLAYDDTYYADIVQEGAGGLSYRTYGGTAHKWQQSGTTVMNIDGSGRVTKPYQPMFYAYPSTGGSIANATVLPFNTAPVNVGSCFNTSTYRFTAPIAGTYYFVAQPAFLNPNNCRMALRVNTTYVFIHEQAPVTGWQTMPFSYITTLAANDYVDIYNGTGSSFTLDPGSYSGFMGFLIG